MTLADILIPLAGSISNEKALKMREACDLLESRVDINQRGTNHAHDLISLLTDRVKELERDNLDRRLTKLERAVDVLDRQRVETLNLRVNGLEHTKDRHKRILEFIEYECVSPLEDRVSKLESATKNTGEGSTSQTGAVSHSQSGGGSDGTREPARSARIDDRDSMLERVDRIARLDAEVAQLDRNLQAEVVARVKAHCTCTHEKRMHANALNGCLVSGCRCEKYTGEGRAEGARSDDVAGPSTQPVQASPTGVREGVSAVDEGSAASRQAAPFPDPIPAWVPSVEEIQQFIDDGREGDLRALIASRAPAQPSVEEMAERLRVARNAWAGYAPGVVISPSDCWLALDRAAIGGGK